jgi:protein SCO1/2
MLRLTLALLTACGGDPTYIVEGTVREVSSPTELVIAHKAIPGFMGPMTMPFQLASAEIGQGVEVGDIIVARLVVTQEGARLERVRVTGHDPSAEAPARPTGPAPVRAGEALPKTEVQTTQGPWPVGEGQGAPTLLTFLYTTCPMPDLCPATVRRMQELQTNLTASNPAGARLLAVTVDLRGDTPEVLTRYAAEVGADPAIWRLGRVEGEAFTALIARAGLRADPKSGEIDHTVRHLVLNASGTLIERYDDNRFPAERVLQQLQTGGPPAPPGTSGTSTP